MPSHTKEKNYWQANIKKPNLKKKNSDSLILLTLENNIKKPHLLEPFSFLFDFKDIYEPMTNYRYAAAVDCQVMNLEGLYN